MVTLEKILIIRFSSMGDIILTSPLIRVLRKTYPQAKIDFLVKSEYGELLQCNNHISSVIKLETSTGDELQSLRQRIRAARYSAIFDLHNSLRSRYLRTFSGATYVRVVKKNVFARFLLVNLKKNYYPKHVPPVAERYLETARRFGVRDDGEGLEVCISDELCSSVSELLTKFSLQRYKQVIGIVPASKHLTKRWPPERFVELGVKIAHEGNTKTLVFGGKEDIEYCGDIAQMINAQVGWTAVENFAGTFSLLETAAAFDHCHLIISNDTGLMHLAAARKRKVAAIFGSTVREFGFFPYGTENIVVERTGLYCRPCSHIGLDKCPENHFRCMKEIQADDVYSAVQQLLNATSTEMIPTHA